MATQPNNPDDINIWAPGQDAVSFQENNSNNNEKEKEIEKGTLNSILTYLTGDQLQEDKMVDVLLLTHPSFTTSLKLLKKLIERYHAPPSTDSGLVTIVQLRVVNMICKWIETYPSDFEDKDDDNVLSVLHTFINEVYNSKQRHLAAALSKSLKNHQSNQNKRQRQKKHSQDVSLLKFEDIPSELIARQLTLWEYEICSKIQPRECLNLAWTKKDKDKNAPNVVKVISHFNVLSSWVVHTVLLHLDINQRVQIIEKFVEIAQCLLDLKNYNSMFAILGGLQSSPVYRLRMTWNALPKATVSAYDKLTKLVSPAQGFKPLRNALNSALKNPPCILYFGIMLTDLCFLEDGNVDLVNDGQINFHKYVVIFKRIADLQKCLNTPYDFPPIPSIQSMITTVAPTDASIDEEQYQRSLLCEPRRK